MSTYEEEELSRLSVSTAVSIPATEKIPERAAPAVVSQLPREFRFALHTDDDGVVRGVADPRFPGGCAFPLRSNVNILVYPVENEGKHSITLKGEARVAMEWSFIVQMRIRTGHTRSRIMSVVDADVFEFGNREEPIVIDVNDPQVEKLRFDIRFISQILDPLPVFDFGNIELCFNDGLPNLRVHKELLALHSSYMAENLKNVEDGAILAMGNAPRHSFVEVLYQIYRIQRPVWADFRSLTQGCYAYQVETIMEVLVHHLVNYDRFSLEQKLTEATRLQMIDAIGELAYKAEQNGNWSLLVGRGYDAAEELGEPIYHMIICPAIVKAKYSQFGEPYKKSVIPEYNLKNPTEKELKLAHKVLVMGTTLWVNKGILALCGTERFGRGNDGELYPLVTGALQEALNVAAVSLVDALEALFLYLYPGDRTINIEFIRPLIIFAHTHQMSRIKAELELLLAEEPPFTPQILLDHLMYSENYGLENLRRTCLLRVEGSCQAVAAQMVNLPEFKEVLSARTRQLVLDRHCSGWALSWTKLWSKVPTKRLVRGVTNETGGPKPCELEHALHTFHIGASDVAFGGRSALVGQGQ